MKFFSKFSVLAAIGLCLAPGAFAATEAAMGPGASGGGKTVICRTKSGKVRSAELLDLWEARELRQLSMLPAKGSIREMTTEALKAISESVESDGFTYTTCNQNGCETKIGPAAIYEALRVNAEQFLRKDPVNDPSKEDTVIRRMRRIRLEPTDDAYEAAVPEDCAIEQVVRFDDYSFGKGSILIDQDIVDSLDPLNQAALIVHESLYKWLRDFYHEASSLRVRRAVGLAFSGHQFGSLNKKFLPHEYYVCEARDDESGDFPTESGVSRIYVLPVEFSGPEYKDKVLLTFQASILNGLPTIDARPVLKDPHNGAQLVADFRDLSPLVGRRMMLEIADSVQPELQPFARVDEASPGHLAISIGAKSSVFQPQGMKWRRASCEYKTN